MKRIVIGLIVAVLLGSGAVIAAPAYHWLTEHGWELGYECGVWTGKWTVTPGANPMVAAVLTQARPDGNMDYCFTLIVPKSSGLMLPCDSATDPNCHP